MDKKQQDALKEAKAAAEKKKGSGKTVEADKQVAKPASTAVGQALDFEADAGKGQEGVDRDSRAIPFLVVLQPLSPVVVDETVEGAKAGMLMNSVTQELYTEAFFVPCAFQRRFLRWGARENNGGGFKGEFTVAEAVAIRERGEVKELENRLYYPESDGSINPKKSDRLSDTRSHWGLLMTAADENFGQPIIISLTSSGIKISKNFISRIDSVKKLRADGTRFTPPSFSQVFRVGSEKKTNEKGTWFVPTFSPVGDVQNSEVYRLAKEFHALVTAGSVVAAHDSVREAEAGGDSGGGGGGF